VPGKHASADYLKDIVVFQAKRKGTARHGIRHVVVPKFVKFLRTVFPELSAVRVCIVTAASACPRLWEQREKMKLKGGQVIWSSGGKVNVAVCQDAGTIASEGWNLPTVEGCGKHVSLETNSRCNRQGCPRVIL
jgi:hypothetical protein